MIRDGVIFLCRAHLRSFSGSRIYYAWMAFLAIVAWIGAYTFMHQLVNGLGGTHMTDQVPWGAYNANFTYCVGVVVSAVLLVIPAYVYRQKEMYDVALLGGLLAVAAIVACLLFVLVDVGRPDRFWHVIPFIGAPNFPSSMLAWDVVTLGIYFVLASGICFYLLYMKYLGREPNFTLFAPFIALSVALAISTHLITVFLYAGLVGRPFWNSAVVAPRFLGAAFTAGPGILIFCFQIIRRYANYHISQRAIDILRYIVTASLLINLFLLFCEAFKELYAAPGRVSSTRYLFFGLERFGEYYDALVPWIWTAIAMQVIAGVILGHPALARRTMFLDVACVFAIVGVWLEKGLGMVIPGFIPSPQGSIVEYLPSWSEMAIGTGVWAFGLLFFSWMVHTAIPIMTGEFCAHDAAEREPERAEGAVTV